MSGPRPVILYAPSTRAPQTWVKILREPHSVDITPDEVKFIFTGEMEQ